MKMLFFDFAENETEFFNNFNCPDFEIEFIKSSLTDATKLTDEQLNDVEILCISKQSTADQKSLSKFKNLRIISTRSKEHNHIDLSYCRNKHIAVFNVNDNSADKILEITFNNIKDYCKGLHTNQIY